MVGVAELLAEHALELRAAAEAAGAGGRASLEVGHGAGAVDDRGVNRGVRDLAAVADVVGAAGVLPADPLRSWAVRRVGGRRCGRSDLVNPGGRPSEADGSAGQPSQSPPNATRQPSSVPTAEPEAGHQRSARPAEPERVAFRAPRGSLGQPLKRLDEDRRRRSLDPARPDELGDEPFRALRRVVGSGEVIVENGAEPRELLLDRVSRLHRPAFRLEQVREVGGAELRVVELGLEHRSAPADRRSTPRSSRSCSARLLRRRGRSSRSSPPSAHDRRAWSRPPRAREPRSRSRRSRRRAIASTGADGGAGSRPRPAAPDRRISEGRRATPLRTLLPCARG